MQKKTNKGRLVTLIHVARSQLGLCDSDYRAILESVSGKSSCTELTLFELEQVLKAMKKLGFTVKKLPVKDMEVGSASRVQLEYIKGMWELVAREKTDRALYSFIRRITGAAHPRFMTEKDAQDVISALRAMMVKAGFHPDGIPDWKRMGGNFF